MKKVLLSTALLSTFALAAISVDAAEIGKTSGDASVTFADEGGVTPPDKLGPGNIVIGKVPKKMNFQDAKVQASGSQSVGLKANAEADKWIMINDDRPVKGTPGANENNVMGPWTLKVSMSELKDDNSADTIAAALNYKFSKGLERYDAGKKIKNSNNVDDYEFKDPSATNVFPYTMSDKSPIAYGAALTGLDANTPKVATFEAGGAPVTLLERTGEGLDPDNNGKVGDGGQGYLLTFSNPTLVIKEPVKKDLDGKTYSASISYILENGL